MAQDQTKKSAAKKTDKEIVLDANGKVLGRIASDAAFYLQDKHLPSYMPHRGGETNVVVKNADKVVVTGKKTRDKIYWRHSGYPGGIYGTSFEELRQQSPEKLMQLAVKRMLPKNRLQKPRLKRLIIQ